MSVLKDTMSSGPDGSQMDESRDKLIELINKCSQTSTGKQQVENWMKHMRNPNYGKRTGRLVPFTTDLDNLFVSSPDVSDSDSDDSVELITTSVKKKKVPSVVEIPDFTDPNDESTPATTLGGIASESSSSCGGETTPQNKFIKKLNLQLVESNTDDERIDEIANDQSSTVNGQGSTQLINIPIMKVTNAEESSEEPATSIDTSNVSTKPQATRSQMRKSLRNKPKKNKSTEIIPNMRVSEALSQEINNNNLVILGLGNKLTMDGTHDGSFTETSMAKSSASQHVSAPAFSKTAYIKKRLTFSGQAIMNNSHHTTPRHSEESLNESPQSVPNQTVVHMEVHKANGIDKSNDGELRDETSDISDDFDDQFIIEPASHNDNSRITTFRSKTATDKSASKTPPARRKQNRSKVARNPPPMTHDSASTQKVTLENIPTPTEPIRDQTRLSRIPLVNERDRGSDNIESQPHGELDRESDMDSFDDQFIFQKISTNTKSRSRNTKSSSTSKKSTKTNKPAIPVSARKNSRKPAKENVKNSTNKLHRRTKNEKAQESNSNISQNNVSSIGSDPVKKQKRTARKRQTKSTVSQDISAVGNMSLPDADNLVSGNNASQNKESNNVKSKENIERVRMSLRSFSEIPPEKSDLSIKAGKKSRNYRSSHKHEHPDDSRAEASQTSDDDACSPIKRRRRSQENSLQEWLNAKESDEEASQHTRSVVNANDTSQVKQLKKQLNDIGTKSNKKGRKVHSRKLSLISKSKTSLKEQTPRQNFSAFAEADSWNYAKLLASGPIKRRTTVYDQSEIDEESVTANDDVEPRSLPHVDESSIMNLYDSHIKRGHMVMGPPASTPRQMRKQRKTVIVDEPADESTSTIATYSEASMDSKDDYGEQFPVYVSKEAADEDDDSHSYFDNNENVDDTCDNTLVNEDENMSECSENIGRKPRQTAGNLQLDKGKKGRKARSKGQNSSEIAKDEIKKGEKPKKTVKKRTTISDDENTKQRKEATGSSIGDASSSHEDATAEQGKVRQMKTQNQRKTRKKTKIKQIQSESDDEQSCANTTKSILQKRNISKYEMSSSKLSPPKLVVREPSPEAVRLGLRRSSRARVRPLQTWFGERMVYGDNDQLIGIQTNDQVETVHVIDTSNYIDVMKKSRKTTRRKQKDKENIENLPKTKKRIRKNPKKADVSENDNIVEEESVNHPIKSRNKDKKNKANVDTSDNMNHESSADNDQLITQDNHPEITSMNDNNSKLIIQDTTPPLPSFVDNNEVTKQFKFTTAEEMNTTSVTILENDQEKEIAANKLYSIPESEAGYGISGKAWQENDPVRFTKGISNSQYAMGTVMVQPGQTKELTYMKKGALCFFLAVGVVEVVLGSSMMTLQAGSYFHVPPGNRYSIKNISSDTKATLAFTQVKN